MHARDKPRAQWIGYDISRHRQQILLPTNRPIMKASLPKRPPALQTCIHRPGTARFGRQHQRRQCAVLQFEQPMEVIRHHHPDQGVGPFLGLCLAKLFHHQASRTPIGKDGITVMGDGSEQLDLAGFGIAPGAQVVSVGKIGHSIALLCFWEKHKASAQEGGRCQNSVPDVSGRSPSPASRLLQVCLAPHFCVHTHTL